MGAGPCLSVWTLLGPVCRPATPAPPRLEPHRHHPATDDFNRRDGRCHGLGCRNRPHSLPPQLPERRHRYPLPSAEPGHCQPRLLKPPQPLLPVRTLPMIFLPSHSPPPSQWVEHSQPARLVGASRVVVVCAHGCAPPFWTAATRSPRRRFRPPSTTRACWETAHWDAACADARKRPPKRVRGVSRNPLRTPGQLLPRLTSRSSPGNRCGSAIDQAILGN